MTRLLSSGLGGNNTEATEDTGDTSPMDPLDISQVFWDDVYIVYVYCV